MAYYRWSSFGAFGIQILDASPDMPGFYSSVSEDLGRINERNLGKSLLKSIEDARPRVTRVPAGGQRDPETLAVTFEQGVNVVIIPKLLSYTQSGYSMQFGTGDDALVRNRMVESPYPASNPPGQPFYLASGCNTEAADVNASMDQSGSVSIVRYSNAQMTMVSGQYTPSFIVLAHELIHALHNLQGTRSNTAEENWTRGVGTHGKDPMTENTLRDEWGLPRREDAL